MRCTKYPGGRKIRLHALIGAAIRAKREAAGETQASLAAAIGCGKSALDKSESGAGAAVWMLAAIAEHYDCTIDELVPVDVERAA
jgi:transcriptional regulator with XRE-family HTH domain